MRILVATKNAELAVCKEKIIQGEKAHIIEMNDMIRQRAVKESTLNRKFMLMVDQVLQYAYSIDMKNSVLAASKYLCLT